jgi:hypothetical protein
MTAMCAAAAAPAAASGATASLICYVPKPPPASAEELLADEAETIDLFRPGPPGAVKQPPRVPQSIGFLWRFCMGAQGA